MTIIKKGVELIKKFESFSSKIYTCPSGLKTIGYGHVILKDENFDNGIDQEEAIAILYLDIKKAEKAVLRNIQVKLNIYQYAAIVSFTFNVGAAALQRSCLRMKINNNQHNLVPGELEKWVYVGAMKMPGLLARRRKEIELYNTRE